MKRRFWKQSLSLALTFALILAMPCVTSVWAGEKVDYVYGEWDAETNTVEWKTETKEEGTYTKITSDNLPTTWSESWYVAEGEVTIGTEDSPQRVTVSGDVHLILKDGCNLIVNGGIHVAQGNSLTIYAQTENGEVNNVTGQLTAVAKSSNAAGIGGNGGEAGGAITIHGGKVAAAGNNGGAGIGGGSRASGGTTNIYGGTVEAAGNNDGAGIGGGSRASGGTTNIYGGKVTANGGNSGAGIGSGKDGDSNGAVTISGGMITASSNSTGGAGIRSGTITISGGTVNASNGSSNSIGISGSEISISSGTVNASSDGSGGVAINGSGTIAAASGSTLTISSSTYVYGNVTFEGNVEISGGMLVIDSSTTLTNNGYIELTNAGTITNNGTIVNTEQCTILVREGCTIANDGTITNNGWITTEDDPYTEAITGNGKIDGTNVPVASPPISG